MLTSVARQHPHSFLARGPLAGQPEQKCDFSIALTTIVEVAIVVMRIYSRNYS